VPRLVSYAAGVLLAAAFLHLLPEAFNSEAAGEGLFAVVLAGILAFFVLEKAALWRHRHAPEATHAGHAHSRAGTLILIGDGVHNFIDGILIAAAFLTDPAVGVSTTIAIVAHEIPQEVGDFMVLLSSGYTRARALLFNLLSSLTAVAGDCSVTSCWSVRKRSCRTRWRWPRRASSTSRWRILFPTCIARSTLAARYGSLY